MAQPYVGEIRMFAGNFAPAGWMFCEGQILPISENETLFQLIGTTYGGDGESTFALPDLRGRIPMHQGNGFILAETGGVEEVTLNVSQIPAHSHVLTATKAPGSQSSPARTPTSSPPPKHRGPSRVRQATASHSHATSRRTSTRRLLVAHFGPKPWGLSEAVSPTPTCSRTCASTSSSRSSGSSRPQPRSING